MIKIYITKTKTNPYEFVKTIAAQKYNIDKNEIKILKNRHGKPYFEKLPDLHFNISNSENFQLIAIGDKPIGVDIEKLRSANLKVIKRFKEDEQEYVLEKDCDYRFFEIWTKKEAFLKYKGTGISGGLDSFSTFEIDVPTKTFKRDSFLISVCTADNYRIIDLAIENHDCTDHEIFNNDI